MENLKHTRAYAQSLAFRNTHVTGEKPYIEGYMKAIEETGVTDLLEALTESNKFLQDMRDNGYSISNETLSKNYNAINKATK